MNMHREETVLSLFKFGHHIERRSLGRSAPDMTRQNLSQLPFGVVTPSMIATTDYCGASFIFRHNWESPMTTNVVKTANDSVLGEYQENRIRAYIISIIASRLCKTITVRDAVPSLTDQQTCWRHIPARKWLSLPTQRNSRLYTRNWEAKLEGSGAQWCSQKTC